MKSWKSTCCSRASFTFAFAIVVVDVVEVGQGLFLGHVQWAFGSYGTTRRTRLQLNSNQKQLIFLRRALLVWQVAMIIIQIWFSMNLLAAFAGMASPVNDRHQQCGPLERESSAVGFIHSRRRRWTTTSDECSEGETLYQKEEQICKWAKFFKFQMRPTATIERSRVEI